MRGIVYISSFNKKLNERTEFIEVWQCIGIFLEVFCFLLCFMAHNILWYIILYRIVFWSLICMKFSMTQLLFVFFKVNNRNTRTIYKICSKLKRKHHNNYINAVMVSLLLTLNKFQTLLWHFNCCLCAINCQLGIFYLM